MNRLTKQKGEVFMKHLFKVFVVIGFVLALSASAYALPMLTIGNGSGTLTAGLAPGNTGDNNFVQTSFFGSTNDIGGYYGATISLNEAASLRLDYFGAEAGYLNKFYFDNDLKFTTPGITNNTGLASNYWTPLSSKTVSANAGELLFKFVTGVGVDVLNSTNPDNTVVPAGPNFFATFNPFNNISGQATTSGNSVWLFLDDGNTTDDNHDDMLVRVSVPEPSTMLLLGLGLLGFAGARRKFKN